MGFPTCSLEVAVKQLPLRLQQPQFNNNINNIQVVVVMAKSGVRSFPLCTLEFSKLTLAVKISLNAWTIRAGTNARGTLSN
jgi:hypothetical protein